MKSAKQKKATVGVVLDMIRQLGSDERQMLLESLTRTVAAEMAEMATVKAENASV